VITRGEQVAERGGTGCVDCRGAEVAAEATTRIFLFQSSEQTLSASKTKFDN